MMSENRSCMFLLLSAVAGWISVSGAGIAVKYVCPGNSVQAFQNIEFNHCNATVSLHINGDINAEIAKWSIQNCIRNESLQPEYQRRLVFDQTGTITMKNFVHFDQAKYVVISKMDPLPKIYEVQLSLMVAPNKDCKPTIEKIGNILIASLKAKDCGKPVTIPYWKDNGGVSNINEPILKLTPGMEAKEYYACIKGAALTCVKNVTSHDFCTKFIPEGSRSPPAKLETYNADQLIVVCIILGIFVFLAILASAVIYIRDRLRKKNANNDQTIMLLETPKLWTKHFGKLDWEDIRKLLNDDKQMGKQTYCENANNDQTIMLLETPKLWTKHFGKLDWEDIRKLLNDDKQMGKQTYCETANNDQTIMLLETPNLWTKHFGKLDWEDIRKLLNDDQQMGLQTYCDNLKSQNDNRRREKERQGDAATCSKCSSSLPLCTVCMGRN